MSAFFVQQALVPPQAKAQQLFVLLSRSNRAIDIDASNQMIQVLASPFPYAVFVTLVCDLEAPVEQGLDDDALRELIEKLQPDFIQTIQALQKQYEVEPNATALLGVGVLGSLVLELSKLPTPLAGRLITFGSRYVSLPTQKISLDQTIHLLHAHQDDIVPADHAKAAHAAIAQAQGDATIDIASNTSNSFEPALHDQLLVRLRTCVPLKIWQEVKAMQFQCSQEESPTIH